MKAPCGDEENKKGVLTEPARLDDAAMLRGDAFVRTGGHIRRWTGCRLTVSGLVNCYAKGVPASGVFECY
ncbi:MAG: hypothetical protein ACK4F6_09750 [Hylemonella sp.]